VEVTATDELHVPVDGKVLVGLLLRTQVQVVDVLRDQRHTLTTGR
jgi:hypothetical protein